MPTLDTGYTKADYARFAKRRAEYAERLKIKYPHLLKIEIKKIIDRKCC